MIRSHSPGSPKRGVLLGQVLSDTKTLYDANGNALFAIATDRRVLVADTVLGEPTGSSARVSYAGTFYDGADRPVASADYGTTQPALTNGVPTSEPTASASTVLLTTYGYDAAGRRNTITDPNGHTTTQAFDAAGRVTLSKDPGANTVAYTYDGSEHVLSMTASNTSGTAQTTAYVYGVTTGGGSGINSNDVLSAVQYPNLTTGLASGTQQVNYTVDA